MYNKNIAIGSNNLIALYLTGISSNKCCDSITAELGEL